jgi:hypothetical protein
VHIGGNMETIITGEELLDKYTTQIIVQLCFRDKEAEMMLDIVPSKIKSNLVKYWNNEELDVDLTEDQKTVIELIGHRITVAIEDAHSPIYTYIPASKVVDETSRIYKTIALKLAMYEVSLCGWATVQDITKSNSQVIQDKDSALKSIEVLSKQGIPVEGSSYTPLTGVPVTNMWK